MNSTGSWSAGGHRYVRYADDCNIYVRSERGRSTSDEEHHEIHHAEAQAQSERVKECGGETAAAEVPWIHLYRRTRGQASNRAQSPWSVFKRRVREITRRAKGVSMDATMEELAPYMRGWRSYFGFCETPRVLVSLTCWVRARPSYGPNGDNGKQPVVVGQLSWHWAYVPNWRATRAAAAEAPGTSAHAKALSVALSPRPISNRSVSRIWRMRTSVTISNPPCTDPYARVEWQGSAGNRCPYADQVGLVGSNLRASQRSWDGLRATLDVIRLGKGRRQTGSGLLWFTLQRLANRDQEKWHSCLLRAGKRSQLHRRRRRSARLHPGG